MPWKGATVTLDRMPGDGGRRRRSPELGRHDTSDRYGNRTFEGATWAAVGADRRALAVHGKHRNAMYLLGHKDPPMTTASTRRSWSSKSASKPSGCSERDEAFDILSASQAKTMKGQAATKEAPGGDLSDPHEGLNLAWLSRFR